MAPFILELSSLEVEPLNVTAYAPKQERSIESITVALGNFEIEAVLMGTLPVNDDSCVGAGPQCCCCCCPCCCG